MEFPAEKRGRFVIGISIGLIVGILSGLFLGWTAGKRETRVEAVKEGHARHRITDEFGTTVFEWLPGQKGEFTGPTSPPK